MGTFLSRKEQRKIEEQRILYRNLKKTAAVLGTTVTAVSTMAPLAPIVTVLADEPDSSIQITDETIENVTTETTSESTQVAEETQVTVEATEETQVLEEVVTSESVASETKEVLTPFAQSPLARSGAVLSPSGFIEMVAQQAANVAQANDLYASVMIAQAIIESGWGKSTLSQAPYYNLFGIKGSYNGQTVYMSTQEYLNGQWVTKSEPFRQYPSFAESFADNAYTLKNVSFQSGVYYYSGAWKSNTNSYRDATAWLTGRYATDPGYAAKLNSTIEAYGLTRYDTPSAGSNSQEQAPNTNVNTETNQNSSSNTPTDASSYTVKSGDSIWLIANQHGISMDQLRSWNNLSGDFIYPGQKLIVNQTGNLTPTTPETNTNINTETNQNNTNSTTTNSQSYTVKSGDSIWLISNQHGISMAQLRSWNNLSGDFIYPGQKLIVNQTQNLAPSVPSTPATPGTTTNVNTETNQNNTNSTTTNSQSYTVKSGDSIWSIANQHGISMAQLRSWNNLTGDLIHPNQKLIVKQGTSTTVTTPTTPSTNQVGTSSNQKTHTVKSGDSLWALAQTYQVSIQQLKTLNALSSDTIYIGQSLKVI